MAPVYAAAAEPALTQVTGAAVGAKKKGADTGPPPLVKHVPRSGVVRHRIGDRRQGILELGLLELDFLADLLDIRIQFRLVAETAPLPNRLAGGGVRTEQPRKDRLGKEGPRMGRKQVEGEA